MNWKPAFWVFTRAVLAGKEIPGDFVFGPCDTREEAAPYLRPDTKLWIETAPPKVEREQQAAQFFSEEQQRTLRAMAESAGWQEVGGRVVRNLDGEAVGRTHWVGMPDWALGFGYSKAEIQSIVEKAITGKALGNKQRLLLKSMLQTVAEASAIDCPF